MIIKVVGLDPSMSNFGFCKAMLDLNTLEVSEVDLRLVKTESGKDKRVRKNSDDLERARALHEAIKEECADSAIAFVEVPHGSQSARAMASYGMCIGLLASVPSFSMIQLSERQLKEATLGKRMGTKEEAIEWATKQHPEANWLKRGGKITKNNEHLADALAAIYAGVRSDDFKNARAILQFMEKDSA